MSEPAARRLRPCLPGPQLSDNRSHELRLRSALEEELGESVSFPLSMLPPLARALPDSNWSPWATVVHDICGWRLAHVSATEPGPLLGLAVDLGSTTVVFYLIDLAGGHRMGNRSYPNPQRAHGEDILERILFARKEEGLLTLQREVVELFNSAAQELCSAASAAPEDIHYVTVAGNTTMIHFLLGLDPSHICREPYLPVANRIEPFKPGEIGLNINPEGCVYCFPNVGSYFGGDLLAGIIASGMHKSDEISMLIDVGTNAEVILGNKDWMVACAGAAGPALEGGILACGMRAQPGAIERVEIDSATREVTYRTIGGEAPKGLCGSGIIDLLAAMFAAGIVDPTGKLQPSAAHGRIVEINGTPAYIVAPAEETAHGEPVYITQSDIKNLIRSKGAMYTILNVVIQSVGISFEDIDHFYVAGAFGNYIDPQKAITIGMLPDMPLERFKGLGNAAGEGACSALLDRQVFSEVEEVCSRITYLEMNVRGDFMNQLTAALFLPHTDLSRFPTVRRQLAHLF